MKHLIRLEQLVPGSHHASMPCRAQQGSRQEVLGGGRVFSPGHCRYHPGMHRQECCGGRAGGGARHRGGGGGFRDRADRAAAQIQHLAARGRVGCSSQVRCPFVHPDVFGWSCCPPMSSSFFTVVMCATFVPCSVAARSTHPTTRAVDYRAGRAD